MASTYRGYPGSAPVPPTAPEGSNDPIPLVSASPPLPPPPPSARRGTAAYPAPLHYGVEAASAEVPQIDQFAETTPREEENPFAKPPSRFRRWLKRPSREVMRTSGIAVLAAALGWVVGAKPWKPKPVARAAMAMKSAPRMASATRPAAPRRVALMTHAAMPAKAAALKPTVVSAKPSQPTQVTNKAVTNKAATNKALTNKTVTGKTVTTKATTAAKKPAQVATKPAKAK